MTNNDKVVKITAVLWQHDFAGIRSMIEDIPGIKNIEREYKPEAVMILERFDHTNSSLDVVYAVFSEMFHPMKFNKDNFTQATQEIWNIINAYSVPESCGSPCSQ